MASKGLKIPQGVPFAWFGESKYFLNQISTLFVTDGNCHRIRINFKAHKWDDRSIDLLFFGMWNAKFIPKQQKLRLTAGKIPVIWLAVKNITHTAKRGIVIAICFEVVDFFNMFINPGNERSEGYKDFVRASVSKAVAVVNMPPMAINCDSLFNLSFRGKPEVPICRLNVGLPHYQFSITSLTKSTKGGA